MEQRVSLITLGVADLEASAAFYEALGWRREVTEEAGIIVFNCLGQVVGLYPKAALAEDMGVDPNRMGGGTPAMTLGYNVREKAHVDALCAKVPGAGGTVLKPPHEIFWGGYSSYIADLDGHVWEIAWNPFSPPREDGTFQWGG